MAKKKSKRTPGKKVIRKSHPKRAKKAGSPATAKPRGNAEVARTIDLFKWAHEMTGKLCAGFGEHQMLAQPSKSDNHLLWQIGHLACSYSWFASMLDGKPATLGEMYDKLFGWGSKPTSDASMYPAHAEVRRIHDEQYTRVLRAAAAMSDADSLKAPAIDSGGFAKHKLDVLQKCIWHEGWHQGQISSLRRALGLPGVMG
ncbi:MAG TPA: DinB family protein [Phycisphaerales bacterium]|nr:DinB family protein [Phycisphaerales bacterium]